MLNPTWRREGRRERKKRADGLPPAEAGGWTSADGHKRRQKLYSACSWRRGRRMARALSRPAGRVIKLALSMLRAKLVILPAPGCKEHAVVVGPTEF